MKNLGRSAVVALIAAGAAAACTPAPSPDPSPPVIDSFEAVALRTEAPVTATLRWRISDPNADALVCRVDLDGDGTPDRTIDPCPTKGDVLVQFSVPGSVTPTLDVTDGTFDAPTASTAPVVTTAGPSEPFNITLHFAPGIDPQFAAAFQAAAARWQQVVVDGFAPQQLSVPADYMGWIPAFDGQVDDLLIAVRATVLDGPYGLLGQAGQLARRANTEPYFGMMEFDSDDLQIYAANGELHDLILHEMGHVLGLGPSWLTDARIDDLFTDPSFNGAAAGAAWHELGGTGNVPVENTGALGTWAVHWRESVFGTELMTGWLDHDERLSRVTIAALADQGFGVDLTQADEYQLPSATAARRIDRGPDQHTTPVQLLSEDELREITP